MIKRYIYIGLFALVCVSLLTLFFLKRMDKITPIQVIQAVPEDAVVFVENLDYEFLSDNFFPSNRIWIDLVNTSGLSRMDSSIHLLLGRLRNNEAMQDFLLKNGFSLSLHLVGKDQLTPLMYLSYGDRFNDHEFEEELHAILEEEAMVNERKYETETLFDVSGPPGSVPGKFTFACVNGTCVLSPVSMLVESAVRTIHDDVEPAEDAGLQRIRETAGRYVHGNVYLNYSRLHSLLQPVVSEGHWGSLRNLSGLALWGEFDLDIKEDALILHGMSLPDPEQGHFLSAFTSQSTVKMQLHELMPSGTSYFLHFGVGDKETFLLGMRSFLSHKGLWDGLDQRTEEVKKKYDVDPLLDLMQLLDDEMAWFAMEGETRNPGEEILMVEIKSRSEAQEVSRSWVEKYLRAHTFGMDSYRSVYRLDQQTAFHIYKMPPFYEDKPIGEVLFKKYFTVYENCLIFGPSVEALSRVIYQNVLHKTFVSDPVYKEMSDYLSNRANVSLYLSPYTYLDFRNDWLNEDMKKLAEKTELFLRRIPGLVMQFSAEGDLLYQSLSFKYTSQIKEKAMTVWESMLDSSIVVKPALVVNHNTNEKEIFVQDASNKIYLINSTGRVLWEQLMDGPISGKVHQVDFYKNGKLQFLFNTRDKLHLIDRNGNHVERYPVSLRSPATAPLALFDYDKSRDYRIFVPGEDRRIYVYNMEGNLVQGWKFGKSESLVTTPPQHFRIGVKDYIVFSDRTRSYFLDRRGRERVRPKEKVSFSPGNPFSLDMNIQEGKPRWICSDTTGNVKAIYVDGSVLTLLEHKAPAGHRFRTRDLSSDGIPEFIFAEGSELLVLDQDGKRLFTYKVKGHITDMPDIYKFSSSDLKIGITDRTRNRIYLINSDGSLYEGFPLEGSTRFSIGYFAGSDSRFNLIVGSSNNFLYNYSIE